MVQPDRSTSSAHTTWQKLGCEAKACRKNAGETPARYDVYARWPESKTKGVPHGQNVFAAGGPEAAKPAPPGTYDPGLGRAARGVPSDGLPVASLHR